MGADDLRRTELGEARLPTSSFGRPVPSMVQLGRGLLGRPLGYLVFSLMALIGDSIYEYFSKGFRGQPSLGFKVHFSDIENVRHICLHGVGGKFGNAECGAFVP